MGINSFVNVRTMTDLLQTTLLDRKDIDRHMINNANIRARKKS